MARRTPNFSKMDLAELVQLRDQIETALTGKIVIEREELQSKLAELGTLERRRTKSARRAANGANGAKASNVASTGRKSKSHPLKGRKAEPKYLGPSGETWAGRGLAPKWLTALEKKGKKREQFLVAK